MLCKIDWTSGSVSIVKGVFGVTTVLLHHAFETTHVHVAYLCDDVTTDAFTAVSVTPHSRSNSELAESLFEQPVDSL